MPWFFDPNFTHLRGMGYFNVFKSYSNWRQRPRFFCVVCTRVHLGKHFKKINCVGSIFPHSSSAMFFFHKVTQIQSFFFPKRLFFHKDCCCWYLVWVAVEAESGLLKSGLGCWMWLVRRKLVGTFRHIAWPQSWWRSSWFIKGHSHK